MDKWQKILAKFPTENFIVSEQGFLDSIGTILNWQERIFQYHSLHMLMHKLH